MLVNLRHTTDPDVVRIDRSGPWGNPVVLGKPCRRCRVVHTREGDDVAALVCYGRILLAKLEWPAFAESLQCLEGKVLGCWCAPARCHGDVLGVYLEAYSTRRGIISGGDPFPKPGEIEASHQSGVRAVREYVSWLESQTRQLSLL